MINRALSLLRKDGQARAYSRVVANDTKNVSKLLQKAAKRANEDQRRLVSQP